MPSGSFTPPTSPEQKPGKNSGPTKKIGFVAPNRDAVTTIRDDGSRRFLHPADARGKFTRARQISAIALIAVYLLLPWIKIGGYPAVFLDVGERRFHLFGWTLAAQDLWLMFFLISGLGFSLFLLTSLFGRVWCGWACPQTVFLEHVFRRVERWLEGDAPKRRALDAAPWTLQKIARRAVKQVLFFAFAAAIAHLFLAYFVSIPELWLMMKTQPREHWTAFLFVFVATSLLYFNFSWFREQLCIVICPYGRMQSALIDDNSLVIGYDTKRGEPRGKVGTINAGACVDCNRCVQVCPTGIDIRQGLQIECIGCAACIDACDTVMMKLKRPTGLIRYDSAEGFLGRRTRWARPRTFVYAVLLFIGAAVTAWALSTVRPANLSVTRLRGAPYFVDADYVRNQFLVRLVNKRTKPVRFALTASGLPEGTVVTGFAEAVEVGSLGEEVRPFVIQIPRGKYVGKFAMKVDLTDQPKTFEIKRDVEFVGPDAELLKEDERERREHAHKKEDGHE